MLKAIQQPRNARESTCVCALKPLISASGRSLAIAPVLHRHVVERDPRDREV
jgi:hypothetical protein